jgi:hypothetical protein
MVQDILVWQSNGGGFLVNNLSSVFLENLTSKGVPLSLSLPSQNYIPWLKRPSWAGLQNRYKRLIAIVELS